MTICIAAICIMDVDSYDTYRCSPGQEVIIGISDRMVSTNYYKAEVDRTKYSKVVGSIVVSSSGLISAHKEVFETTKYYFLKDFYYEPRAIPVIDVAELYSKNLINYMVGRKDKITQWWTGLNYKEFKKRRNEFDIDDRGGAEKELKELAEMEAIISGIDESGAHVYLVRNDGSINFEDTLGLAIIGSGTILADLEISANPHTRKSLFSEALIRLYMAKRRAEKDFCVGEKYTDIFVISNDHSVNILPEDSIKLLDDLYKDICAKQEQAIKEAGNTMASFLSNVNKIRVI